MITRAGTEIWMECDECHLRWFIGFEPMSKESVVSQAKTDGWTLGKRVLCECCSKKAENASDE